MENSDFNEMNNTVEENFEEIKENSTDAENIVERRNYQLAGLWARFLALIIDTITISALVFLIIEPVTHLFLTEDAILSSRAKSIIGLFSGFVYFIFMTKIWGQTLGKMIFNIKVIKQDGQTLDWLTVIFRESIGRFISQTVLFIGYIWALFQIKRQSWHDLISDTVVVYEEEPSVKI